MDGEHSGEGDPHCDGAAGRSALHRHRVFLRLLRRKTTSSSTGAGEITPVASAAGVRMIRPFLGPVRNPVRAMWALRSFELPVVRGILRRYSVSW